MSVLEYKVVKDETEYLNVCKSTMFEETKEISYSLKKKAPFDNLDDWIDFFGAWSLRELDDDVDVEEELKKFIGHIDLKPEETEYPVLVAYNFAEGEDRFGRSSNVIWDWTPLNELKLTIK